MDRFEKWAEYIMQNGDKILEKKKHRNMLIRRVSFSCASAFAVIIVVFFAWKSTPPKIDLPSETIISETSIVTPTTTVEVTTTTDLPQTTEQSNTTFTTTFANSETKTTETVTNVTTVSNRTEHTTSNHTLTTTTTKYISPVTTALDTTKTTTQAKTTTLNITETTVTTTVKVTSTSTTTQVVTTTTRLSGGNPPPGGGTQPSTHDPWYDMPIYRQYYNAFLDGYVADLTPIYRGGYPISDELIGESISGAKMTSQNRVDGVIKQCQAEAFYIKDFSDDKVIAIKFKDNYEYYLYHTDKTDVNSLMKQIPPLET